MSEEVVEKFKELLDIMAHLRSENGCPWDREQNHSTIKHHLVEESYEVVEAIEEGNKEKLKEELGDLLLQIIFHAQLAEEAGTFTIKDVLKTVIEKLRTRHPHVFGDKFLATSQEVLANWEKMKLDEGNSFDFPKSLPALLLTRKIQEKAKRLGFNRYSKEEVYKEFCDKYMEFERLYKKGLAIEEMKEQLGKLLFTIVNLARCEGINLEDILREEIRKYVNQLKEKKFFSEGIC